jgi:hypothetical protein
MTASETNLWVHRTKRSVPSRQACQHATQPVQHSLLLSRSGVTLRACLANTDTDVTATLSDHAGLRRQTSTITASHNVLWCQDRNSRIDSRKHKVEIRSRRTRRAARSREVDVEVDVRRQVGRRSRCEQGGSQLGSELGVDSAVRRSTGVPGSWGTRCSREGNGRDACCR